jgi:RHS repeat-associated protein
VVAITVVGSNGPPAVSLTSPANNAVLGTGRTATLAATAADSDGIAQVEFYRGSLLMATDTTAPYTFDWTDLPNGTYTLTAKAYDVLGAVTTSAPVTLTVRPIATITVNPASPTAGNSVLVTVDGAAFCTAVNVDFGDGNTQTFVDGGGLPITNTHVWATSGAKTLIAQGLGGACDSQATVTITVLTPPSVSLTAPAPGANFLAPATIEFAASASAAQGSILHVMFYANGSWLGTDWTAPYTFTWSGVGNGTYSLLAVATDTLGAGAASSSVTVTVGDPPPSTVLGVSVTPNPVTAGQSATITVTGTNPCTMLWMDFGDGDWWIAPIGGLPFTTTKTWTTAGNYTVYAAGYYSCSGEATRAVTVTGAAPAPEPVAVDVEMETGGDAPDEPLDANSSVESGTQPSGGDSVPDVTVLVDLNGTGSGTVTGAVTCTGTSVTCSVVAAQGSMLSFTATPNANMNFTGWTGACTGLNPTCTVEAYDHRLVVANFAAATPTVTTYYHLDMLGSVRVMTDAAGNVTDQRHDYRPFGEDTTPLPAPGADPARFLGQQRDSTKFDQFGARYYSMFQGRFSSVDPGHADANLFAPQSWNAYAYARNNPLRYLDPGGLQNWPPYVLGDGSELDNWPFEGSIDNWLKGIGGNGGSRNEFRGPEQRGGRGGPPPQIPPATEAPPPASPPAPRLAPPPAPSPAPPPDQQSKTKNNETSQDVPPCVVVWSREFTNSLNPFTLGASTAAEPALDFAARLQYNNALQYAASRPNSLGGTGLIYPMKSSTFRGMLKASRNLLRASPWISILMADAQGIYGVFDAARRGECR